MFKQINIYFIFTSAILALISLTACGGKQSANTDTLIIGLNSGYPPFEFRDAQGEIIGFDIDVANQMAQQLGKKLVIQDMDFDAVILSLKHGKIDLVISGTNITPARLKEIIMVPYHGEEASSLSLLFWKKIPEGVNSLEDIAHLPNAAVSVQSGSVAETYLRKFASITVTSFDGALAPLMDVKLGKSLASLVEKDTGEYLQGQHPDIQILEVPLPEDEKVYGFGIGIKKGNAELQGQVQNIIKDLKASGKMKELEDQWFKGGK